MIKEEKPNGGIVLEDFNEGDGFYKVNLDYLSKEQVEEIENIVKKWNPEHVESEDERIRKELIEHIKANCETPFILFQKFSPDTILAWLEKQGKFVENKDDEDDVDADFTIYYPLKNGEGRYKCIPYSFYGMLSSFSEDKDMIDFLHLCFYTKEECNEWIKQNESADKVEPKFKVKYAGNEYNVFETKDIAGVTFYGIEDEPNHIDYVKAENCEIISVYAIKEKGSPYPTKPAVFSEKKPKRMISAEAKEALYDKPTDKEMKELLRTEYEKGRADTIAEMEKDWSEEDDVMINKLLAVVKLYYNRSGDDLDKQSCISFLKSLKDKVQSQPKQEWSEEDEKNLQGIIDEIQANKSSAPSYDINVYDRFLSWLKQLKQKIGG